MMDMNGNFPRVAIGLTHFEKHGDVELIAASVNVPSDVRAGDREAEDGGDIVLGKRVGYRWS